ncbi:MAG: hypothetical protein QOG58_1860, partial [Caballeronia sp.]|nr:hypothetical protein [Caballeronia sp.]
GCGQVGHGVGVVQLATGTFPCVRCAGRVSIKSGRDVIVRLRVSHYSGFTVAARCGVYLEE